MNLSKHYSKFDSLAYSQKLDTTQPFDSLSWPFLLEVLRHKGFDPRWCNWISIILSTASTRALLNGNPGRQIWHVKGLRAAKPLFPMLFIIAMDTLNDLVSKAEDWDYSRGWVVWEEFYVEHLPTPMIWSPSLSGRGMIWGRPKKSYVRFRQFSAKNHRRFPP